jgi:hypothetical protein
MGSYLEGTTYLNLSNPYIIYTIKNGFSRDVSWDVM